ncbi:TPA: DUF2797 domain-containing protein [Candidatus Gracilibacteria bacterium]|nr:DUF2797 domain-containing protein [Candidatus Gracilibacteria bacterium]HIQ57298.1 DUF2797 domain-containing protein [Candidatus Gracilibacteria bacterium]
MRIFDFRWDDETKAPFFKYIEDDGSSDISIKKIEQNQDFSITLVDESPRCVGFEKSGKYTKCKNTNEEEISVKKCVLCKKSEDYFPCQFCNGFNCDKFRQEKIENCDATHMVYLALFSCDIVKVGVSRLSRMHARQFEQGSHYTRILVEGVSGVTARRIEHFVGKLGFPDKIPATKKKDIILPRVSLEEGQKILEEKYQAAKSYIRDEMPEMMKYIVEEKFWDMRPFYSNEFSEIEASTKPIHFVTLEEGDSIGGVLKAVKGSFLLIETPTEFVVLLAKAFVGKIISFDEVEKGINKKSGFQGGLF